MPVYTLAGRRVLFMHVPKTGGMAVSAVLQAAGAMRFDAPLGAGRRSRFQPRHATADTVAQVFDPDWFDYAFLIVRDPVQRAISEYRYQRRKAGLHLARVLGFDQWLNISLGRAKNTPGFRDNHFRPQVDYLWPGSQVFRYEDGLALPLRALSALTGLDLVSGLSVKNPSPSLQIAPSAQSRAALQTAYRRDFEEFGYSRGQD